MNGLSTNENTILWADAELLFLTIDYDAISITLIESTEIKKKVICGGYIGYQVIGFWDEMIIGNGSIIKNHRFINECSEALQDKYNGTLPMSGNEIRNENKWKLLQIKLIDNTEIMIVCGVVSIEII